MDKKSSQNLIIAVICVLLVFSLVSTQVSARAKYSLSINGSKLNFDRDELYAQGKYGIDGVDPEDAYLLTADGLLPLGDADFSAGGIRDQSL